MLVVSLSRLMIGTNWFLGYSHTSKAKDQFIKEYQNRQSIVAVLKVFLDAGIDTIMCPVSPLMREAVEEAQEVTGRKAILVVTPHFNKYCGEDSQVLV